MKEYKFKLFYMEPPILQFKQPEIHEFKETDFESAYKYCKSWIKEMRKDKGTQILMLAQTTR